MIFIQQLSRPSSQVTTKLKIPIHSRSHFSFKEFLSMLDRRVFGFSCPHSAISLLFCSISVLFLKLNCSYCYLTLYTTYQTPDLSGHYSKPFLALFPSVPCSQIPIFINFLTLLPPFLYHVTVYLEYSKTIIWRYIF